MIREVNIREVNNGYQLVLKDETVGGEYVYSSLEIFQMLEKIGKFLYGKKVNVEEN